MTKAKLIAVTALVGLVSAVAADPRGEARPAASERLVYVGTYTGGTSQGIYAFRFDDSSGGLTPLGLAAETPSPSFLTSSANGRFVFAVNELQSFRGASSGSVTSFAVDPVTAKLTEISVQPTRGAGRKPRSPFADHGVVAAHMPVGRGQPRTFPARVERLEISLPVAHDHIDPGELTELT